MSKPHHNDISVADPMEMIIDFYQNLDLLSPSSAEQTRKALSHIAIAPNACLADIGCGTGAQTEVLASLFPSVNIVAVDLCEAFLAKLQNRFAGQSQKSQTRNGQTENSQSKNGQVTSRKTAKVKTLCADMANLPFAHNSLDLMYSEGAVYNIGFAAGTKYWHSLIKPHGFLALTEVSWLSDEHPIELTEYWLAAYPEMDSVANKIKQLALNGYHNISHFTLPASCWDAYYQAMSDHFAPFLARWNNAEPAQQFVAECQQEIAMYAKYQAYYGYEFYIAQKSAL